MNATQATDRTRMFARVLGPFLFIVPTTEKTFKTVAKKIDVYTRDDFMGTLQRLSAPRALFSVDGK